MFTGLIRQQGVLDGLRLDRVGGGMRLTVRHELFDSLLVDGESVAVQGVCLTVHPHSAQEFSADILEETLCRTAFRSLPSGAPLNLERSLRVGDRLDGHWVTGHIDGSGRIKRIKPEGADFRVRIACDADMLTMVAEKGSIAVDGISLTVAAVDAEAFEVCVIPATWSGTSLHGTYAGQTVNLECDLIARYLRRLLEARSGTSQGLSLARLAECGYA